MAPVTPPQQSQQETCAAIDDGMTTNPYLIGSLPLGLEAQQACCDVCYGTTARNAGGERCTHFSYSEGDGTCELYGGASTGPAAPQEGILSAEASAGTAMCTVGLGRCDSKVELAVRTGLVPNMPYGCCEACFDLPACVGWNFHAASGDCTLLGGSCDSGTLTTNAAGALGRADGSPQGPPQTAAATAAVAVAAAVAACCCCSCSRDCVSPLQLPAMRCLALNSTVLGLPAQHGGVV